MNNATDKDMDDAAEKGYIIKDWRNPPPTRIWVRLENGTEQILSAATSLVVNRAAL